MLQEFDSVEMLLQQQQQQPSPIELQIDFAIEAEVFVYNESRFHVSAF